MDSVVDSETRVRCCTLAFQHRIQTDKSPLGKRLPTPFSARSKSPGPESRKYQAIPPDTSKLAETSLIGLERLHR